MENLTHSLLGATLAEVALPAGATTTQRRIFFALGVVAANLPDADLVYTRITPPPLGSLLHHRGHTHTLVGLLGLALVLGAVCALPAIRTHVTTVRGRLWTLILVALHSHLVLDSWNSYGVHPFWPLDSRWFYGDTIYILEPWLWVILGVAATLNTQNRRGRFALGALLVLLIVAVGVLHIAPVAAAVALAVALVVLGLLMRSWSPRRRAIAALALGALFVVAMFGVHGRVDALVRSVVAPSTRGHIADVVLSSSPGNPLCWSVLTITVDERAGEYVSTRGTAVPFGTSGCGPRADAVVMNTPVHQSLALLRDVYRRDCTVRAWMQFGRAPQITSGVIEDLRYGSFTTMPLRAGGATSCPPNIPGWGEPRRDLLSE